MGMAKKGSRKLVVDGVSYRWRVSRPRRISAWRRAPELLDEKYLAIAEQYNLGEVADVVFYIPIEHYSNPKSKLLIRYFGLVVDGFLGIEQFSRIKPGLIADIIREASSRGWRPEQKGDCVVEIFERNVTADNMHGNVTIHWP